MTKVMNKKLKRSKNNSSVGVEDPLERVLTTKEEILMFSSNLKAMASQ